MISTGAGMDKRGGCQCGSADCRPKILHSLLSYAPHPGGVRAAESTRLEAPDDKPCHRSVHSPSGSTGSCCNSPRHSPNPAAAPASSSPSPPSNSKLFLLLNGHRQMSKSPAPHAGAGAALEQYPRVIPSPGAASTCSSVTSDGYLYASSHHDLQQEHPLNLKRSFHQTYSKRAATVGSSSLHSGALDLSQDNTADQPIDLSCKKRRLSISSTSSDESSLGGFPKRDVFSPHGSSTGSALNDSCDSILKSILCGQRRQYSGQESPSPWSLPPSPLSHHSTASPRESLTSSILSGILHQRFADSRPGSRCSTPGSTDASSVAGSHISSQTKADKHTTVTLSKKTLFPVTRGVTDWLVEIVQFAKSQAEFSSLPYADQISIMLHSWARLLLLCMAENDFKFAVTPKNNSAAQPAAVDENKLMQSPDTPTMRDVETIERFINKCYHGLALDQDEYKYLKMITLFNQGCLGVESSEYVDSVNSLARQALQRHVRRVQPKNKMRYSQLLLVLPTLFGVNCKMMENLFCRPIIGDADMEVLLKGMLLKL